MFQLLKRMVIILLLAVVVIGATFAFAQSSYADSLSFGGGHERHNSAEFGDSDFPERSGEETAVFQTVALKTITKPISGAGCWGYSPISESSL